MPYKLLKTVFSDNKKSRIELIEKSTGVIEFHRYVTHYDEEEEVYYENRVTPNPSGLYGDLDVAIKEAQRILKLL